MKRPEITVTIRDANTGETVHTETRGAWNAGLRASEAAVRAIARAEGRVYTGLPAVRVGHLFTRTWQGSPGPHLEPGPTLIANVTLVNA